MNLFWRIGGLACHACCAHGMSCAAKDCVAYLHSDTDKDRLWFRCPGCLAANWSRVSDQGWIAILVPQSPLPVIDVPPEWDEEHEGPVISEHDCWAFAAELGRLPTAVGHPMTRRQL